MAHDKAFLICENKCLVEGMAKDEIENDFATNLADKILMHSVLLATGSEPLTDFNEKFKDNVTMTKYPDNNYVETHWGTNFSYMFSGCSNLTSISNLDTKKGTNFEGMFEGCSKLTSIPDLDLSNGVNFNYMFRNCVALKDFTDNPFAPEGSRWQFKDNVDLTYAMSLTREAIVKLFNGLPIISDNKAIQLHTKAYGRLSASDKAIATNKGWRVIGV